MNSAAQHLSPLKKMRMSVLAVAALDHGDGPADVVVDGLAEGCSCLALRVDDAVGS